MSQSSQINNKYIKTGTYLVSEKLQLFSLPFNLVVDKINVIFFPIKEKQ